MTAATGIIRYFAENRVAAMLLMVFILVSGLIAASQLSIQLFPSIDLRTIHITVESPGSTPEEVEEDINRRIEESIIGLRGVERVISTARQGIARFEVELTTFADADSVLNDVKGAIDGIAGFPPVTAEQPKIEIALVQLEVLTLAVASQSATEDELRKVAEQIQSELLEQPEISHVSLHGVREREITIELNEERLRVHNLSFRKIAQKVNRNSLNLSYGELKTESGDIVLHSILKRTTGKEFESIPLITRIDGAVITLGDVATVRDGFADYHVHSELDGVPAVFVRVESNDNQSIAHISEAVSSWLEHRSFPKHVTVSIWNDRAVRAIERIRELLSNGLIGLILVFACLIVFFDLRVAVWVTAGIPLSFIGALLLFGVSDLTVNMGTVFAFFLLIGIVVDDAVVVGENIATQRQLGKNPLDAAVSGASTMFSPVTVGVLTTALAFTPFLFVTEERYQILNVIPFVAFFVLVVSLIEAFLILPAHLAHDRPWSLSPLRELQSSASKWLDRLRDQIVLPIFTWSIHHYVLTPVIAAGIIVASIILISSGVVRVIILDQSRIVSDNIQAEIHLPVGSPFPATLDAARRIAHAALQTEEQFEGDSIKTISIVAGAPIMSLRATQGLERSNSSHLASVRVHLNDQDIRNVSVTEFEHAWRLNIGDTSPIEQLRFQSSRFQPQPSVAYSLRHGDRKTLQSATAQFRAMLEQEPGIYGLSDSMALGKIHYELILTDQGRMANLSPASLGEQLRANFHGIEIQRVQRKHDEIGVVIRYPREERLTLGVLDEERVRQASGRETPLSEVADFTVTRELASLSRINGQQAAFVNGYADEAVTTPIQVRKKIASTHLPRLLEQYPGLRVEVDGGARNEARMLDTLSILVPLVLLAIYVLVAAFLRSYWKPVIVVAGIPLALAGAIASHWILAWDFTAMSIFGVIGVSGVVVNDALILLDRYNTLRRENSELPAIVAASAAMRHRFRAVFITSLTTILGLTPLLYERSEGLLNLVPFVVSMLGGLMFASLFTLFILPSLVMLFEGRKE